MATFGKTAAGASFVEIALDFKRAYRVTLAEPALVSSLSAYLDGAGPGTGSQALKLAIYADDAGAPGALLGASDAATITDGQAAGWVVFTLPSPVPLAGGAYWLAYIGSTATNTAQIYFDVDWPTDRQGNADTYTDGFSDPFGANTVGSSFRGFSLYATYTPTFNPAVHGGRR